MSNRKKNNSKINSYNDLDDEYFEKDEYLEEQEERKENKRKSLYKRSNVKIKEISRKSDNDYLN
ncbi:MAG TPA: hypothetical protein DC057_03400 [Spirochaetia bacterium]|nr:hypothetical protein [Spirochaetia bacterium]